MSNQKGQPASFLEAFTHLSTMQCEGPRDGDAPRDGAREQFGAPGRLGGVDRAEAGDCGHPTVPVPGRGASARDRGGRARRARGADQARGEALQGLQVSGGLDSFLLFDLVVSIS
jgi:hypothetical protein